MIHYCCLLVVGIFFFIVGGHATSEERHEWPSLQPITIQIPPLLSDSDTATEVLEEGEESDRDEDVSDSSDKLTIMIKASRHWEEPFNFPDHYIPPID